MSAFGTGLPSGSRTRPATVIRAGLAGSGRGAGAGRSAPRGAACAVGRFAGPSFIAREWASQPVPVATAARTSTAIAASLSLWINMDFRTSWASAGAGAVSAPPPAACRAAKAIAARVVVSHRRGGMDAEADRGASAAAIAVVESAIPRRTRARRSFSLARSSRLWTVPTGQRSRRAASDSERPSK